MDLLLETPSRVLRRIKENDDRNADLPALPSFSFADVDPSSSASFRHSPSTIRDAKGFSESELSEDDEDNDSQPTPMPIAKQQPRSQQQPQTPQWSTPGQATPVHGDRTVRRPTPGSSGSRVRFAHSVMTRSFSASRVEAEEGSIDASRISYVDGEEQPDDLQSRDTSRSSNRYPPTDPGDRSRSFSGSSSSGRQPSEVDLNDSREYDYSHSRSRESNPAVYREDEDFQEGISLVNALQPVSPSGSPPPAALDASKSKSFNEYEASVRSEQRVRMIDAQNAHGSTPNDVDLVL